MPMLAPNSSVIQLALTGTVGSARADGSEVEVCGPAAMASSKALSFPAVGGHGRRVCRIRADQMVFGEALGEFPGLGVPQPDPVAEAKLVRRGPQHRCLDLSGALGARQAQARGPERFGQPVRR